MKEFYWISSGSVGITRTIGFFTLTDFLYKHKSTCLRWTADRRCLGLLFGCYALVKSNRELNFVAVAVQPTSSTVVVERSKRSTCLGHLLKINSQTLGRSRRYILLHTVIIYSYWGFQFLTCLGPNIIIFRCSLLITLTDQSSQIKYRLKLITEYRAWTIFLLIWEATTEAYSFKCKCISWLGYFGAWKENTF